MISQTDWDLFQVAWNALRGPYLKRDWSRAHRSWTSILNTSNDPKARAIARSLLGQDEPVVSSVKPLERWAGGSLHKPGNNQQTYMDYPDVWVGVFPARD